MRIKWLNHPHAPNKNNTTEHVSRELAAVAIGYGQAVAAPYKNYVERLSEEARSGSSPHNVNPPQVAGIEWSCSGLPTNSTRIVIWRRQGGEVARIENEAQAVQAGCPEAVLKQFRDLTTAATGGINYNELAQRETAQRKAAEAQEAGTWKTLMRRA